MMERTLATLEKYAAYHFSSEEELLANHGCRELARHKTGHDSFSRTIWEFRQKFYGDEILVPAEILDFLREWIISHILVEDMELGRLFRHKAATQS